MSTSKLSIVIEAFTPRSNNTLRGFATVIVPELHLPIIDLGIYEKDSSRWITLPARPQIGRTGSVRKDANGKSLNTPVLEFTDSKTRSAFSARVIAAVLEFAPAAFDVELFKRPVQSIHHNSAHSEGDADAQQR